MSELQVGRILADAEAGKPAAQFLLSQICMQNGDADGMFRWLQTASASGYPDALGALGHCYEKGQGVARNLATAMQYYDRAIAAGAAMAAFGKAQLLYKSRQGADHNDLIFELLVIAAKKDIVPALRTIGYLAAQHESKRALALDCLQRAAMQGDPVSSFNLAWYLLQGWRGETAKNQAVPWLQQAAQAEYPFAATMLASLQGRQAAAVPQPRESAIEFGAAFVLYPEAGALDRQAVNQDPPIRVYGDVLNVIDCAYLIFLASPHMKRAHVIDPDGDKDGMVSQVRTSMSTYIPFETVDTIGRYVELRIVHATGENLAFSEPMSILRYAPGEYYRPHVDYFDPELAVSEEFMKDGGQRTASAVTYLSAPTAGGGTSFPLLNLTVPPTAGGILWFKNCFEDGQVDERSLHAGDTVDAGEKWVVTKWFREEQTQYLQM